MKKTIIRLLSFVAIAVPAATSLTSCSEEATAEKGNNSVSVEQEREETADTLTVFSTAATDWTRTTINADKKFYWTSGDELWVDHPVTSGKFVKSTESTITGIQDYASFSVPGDFSKMTGCNVYYTGQQGHLSSNQSTTDGLKVTIASVQTQTAPADGSHIATDGDCATAWAEKGDNGKYTFMLTHKAAYLRINPYLDTAMPANLKLAEIEITSNENLAGCFAFDKNGLGSAVSGTTNKTIVLKCGTSATEGFNFPTQGSADWATNGCYVVIKPGTHALTVTYKLTNNPGGTTDSTWVPITKTITEREYKANSVTKIQHKLTARSIPAVYYKWGATEAFPGVQNTSYGHESVVASNLCGKMPNVNEIWWYYETNGNAHWDLDEVWFFPDEDKLRAGGIWVKKKAAIAGGDPATLTTCGHSSHTENNEIKTFCSDHCYMNARSFTPVDL